ncbi:MAG: type 1 glutamine amidotransferase domain-containing protein [Solirubrobacteraceae bacterium]|nr:type 1 glutamine amidotransferase domain-containing protein [Solirubrobacteraceae bacterium]
MSASLDLLNPDRPKRVLMVAANAATSPVTGWPVGFWWAELVHPWWEFSEHGYEVTIASPDGGPLTADSWSDPRDESGYSAHDVLSLGFISSPAHAGLVENTVALGAVDLDTYDAILLVGGQSPMVTFVDDERVHQALATFHDSGRVAAAICHATCVLLKARGASGELLVAGKTWTGFANSEEDFADEYVGQRIQPFRIEDEGKALPGTNMIVASRFKSHAIRDGNLITGQQQYSGTAAARLIIGALGV